MASNMYCGNCLRNFNGYGMYRCESCGAILCPDCAIETKKICPYCYADLSL